MVKLRALLLILALCIVQGCSLTSEIPPSSGYPATGSTTITEPLPPSSELGEIPPLFDNHRLAEEPFFDREAPYDFEFEMNERIEWWVRQYSERYRRQFILTLARFDSVRPAMEEILESQGLPRDLVYLSMVESSGKANAVSRTGATGYWQFMAGTARHYDLTVNRWMDERRDLEKSTRAAARYLKNLHALFGDWLLAGAAYNAGEGTINRIMRRNPEVSCFWDISHPMPIKTETLQYVPKFIATLILAKNRAHYGLEVPDNLKVPVPAYETVRVKGFSYLDEIAEAAGFPEAQIVRLNPELIRRCTPPSGGEYLLKVPQGTAPSVARYLQKTHSTRVEYVTHTIRKGDTLIGLGKKYSSSARDIARANRMKTSDVLTIGKILVIPRGELTANFRPANRHRHVVARGENLRGIARLYGVSLEDIVEVNGIRNPSLIHPGTALNIPPQLHASSSPRMVQYRVKKGDTVWGISQRFEVSTSDVIRWNRLKPSARIQPGDKITIYHR